MLSVGLNWIYIMLTTFCTGYGVAYLVEKKLHYHIRGMDSILMTGLVTVTVYAEVFSLFYRVGAVANGILLAVCGGVTLLLHRRIWQSLMDWWRDTSIVKKVLLPILFLLWAYFSSRGYMAYDSDLYHAQSIRWIEEYGVVPGLGNLHERFAYNSAAFAVNALYSMKWLLGRSRIRPAAFLHCCSAALCWNWGALGRKKATAGGLCHDRGRILFGYDLG